MCTHQNYCRNERYSKRSSEKRLRVTFGTNETVVEYFASVNVVLTKLYKKKAATPARETKWRVLRVLISRFFDEIRLYNMKGDFNLRDMEAGLAQVERFQSGQKRRNVTAYALTPAYTGDGRGGAGGAASNHSRGGKYFGRRNGGQSRNQQ